jgi:thioredoxin 2
MENESPVAEQTAATGPRALVRCPFCAKLNRVDLSRAMNRPACGECGRPLLLDRPIAITGDDLDRVVSGSEVPIIVDFYADWCAPCRVMAPILDDLARERMGRVLVTKLNTDLNAAATVRFGIRGIPTLIVFRGGSEFARQTGAVPRDALNALVDRALEAAPT